eukprot:1643607-Karenia_brevis.AAC.1
MPYAPSRTAFFSPCFCKKNSDAVPDWLSIIQDSVGRSDRVISTDCAPSLHLVLPVFKSLHFLKQHCLFSQQVVNSLLHGLYSSINNAANIFEDLC